MALSKSSPSWTTAAPSLCIAAIFAGLACVDAKIVSARARFAAAQARPWPKLPAEAETIGVSSSSRLAIHQSVPRPLKERIGFSVSTFANSRNPSAALAAACSTSGESRNVESMAREAATIPSTVGSGWSVVVRVTEG